MTGLGSALGFTGIGGAIEGNRGRGPRLAGQTWYPDLGQLVTPRLTRVRHTTQDRPLGFVTSWGRSLIPSTRTHGNGRRHPVLA